MTEKFAFEKIDDKHYYLKLDNGLRIVFAFNPNTMLVHCGFLIGTGSRNETKDNNGIAHFIEHTVFKGTSKRKSSQIFDHIETVGGDLNAWTTREKTFFYGSARENYLDRVVDVLSDIVFNPLFPEKEIEKEKNVVKEEIEMYVDSPEESIFDEFQAKTFQNDPLGFPILGSKKSLLGLNRDKIIQFRSENYTSDNIVFSLTGNLDFERLNRLVNNHLIDIKKGTHKVRKYKKISYKPFEKEVKKKFQQVHCVIGNMAYSILDNRKFPLILLNNILGGDWMSSRLNMVVREKHAYVYSISSGINVYSDTGAFTIQFGTDEKYLNKCISLVNKELEKLRNNGVTQSQLERSKRQVFGHFAVVSESNSYIMQSQARNILDYGRLIQDEEFFQKINEVTRESLHETAEEIFNPDKLSKFLYLNKK